MTSRTISIKASSVVCLSDGDADYVIASTTCVDVAHLLDQVLGYDMQVEAFEYLKNHFDKETLRERLCI